MKLSKSDFDFASGKKSFIQTFSSNKTNLSYNQDVLRRFKKNKVAIASLVVIIFITVVSFVSIWLNPTNPNHQNVSYAYLPPKIGSGKIPGFTGKVGSSDLYALSHVPKSTYFVMGTDYLGRDLFSRILAGTRLSLLIALISTAVDLLIGVSYGVISGYLGGKADLIMQRLIEIISSIPSLVVVILMLLVFKPGLISIIIAIAYSSWFTMARLTRAATLKIKNQDFILAAKNLGVSKVRIAFKHILPNISSTIIIQTMFTIPSAIFFEAFLSYIGIGIPAPNASLGTLLSDGQQAFHYLPYQLFFPALMICIIMISFNLLGDGLRDALDPEIEE
ncbi:ABC transporter permease [Xylocopilactobacillus apis]|uniref:Peptide ABC transporter permease n=1 Tax=Xylocopilactobacillus apis TaxID=2932183 RepID=A0AAU9DQ10_9LACO|nr:ABC transporter permease [Xylocopilactobacillus apis]BDR55638.1 peptide ABC transporter permease [Xylocopilactobacillus apis]